MMLENGAVGPDDGGWYTEHNGTTLLTIVEILME